MKRAAEVKPSVSCSEEPVAGDGSICAVSITKRVKLEEPEAADGITRRRRSPKVVAGDGAGIAMKRARKPEKPSKKEKGEEEKSKRSNKKKKKQPPNNQEKRIEKIEEQVKKKKKKVVTWRLSQELLDYLRTKEVMGLLATEAPHLALWASISKMAVGLFDMDQRLKQEIAAEFHENREFDAHVLYQYRTLGYAEIQEEISDSDEADARGRRC